MKRKKSINSSILRRIMSISRKSEMPPQTDYIIMYTFLYKYCSDTVRDFLLIELKDKELTIDEAYKNRLCQDQLVFDSLKLNGFYIKSSEAFIEEVVSNNYSKPRFLPDFLKVFPENIIFSSEYNNPDYFDYLFSTIDNEIDTFAFSSEETHVICETIKLISQLDVLDSDFSFSEVFDVISASNLMHIDSNPQFITQILTRIVLSEKKTINSAYDPFMKDGASLMKLYEAVGYNLKYCYGKDSKKLNYFEASIRNIIKKYANRGKIDVFIQIILF